MTKSKFRLLVWGYFAVIVSPVVVLTLLLLSIGEVTDLGADSAFESETPNYLVYKILQSLLGVADPYENPNVLLIETFTGIGLFAVSLILLTRFNKLGRIAYTVYCLLAYLLYIEWSSDPFSFSEMEYPLVIVFLAGTVIEVWILYLVWLSPFSRYFTGDGITDKSQPAI